MEVHVIRHTPVSIGKDICYGQTNVAVADTFLADAALIKKQLPSDVETIYCSPLERCTALANALSFDSIILDDRLKEMNFGDWENRKWDEINQEELHLWMEDFVHVKTPNGENLIALFERVTAMLDDLRNKSHKKVLIITHAGVIRCIWAYLLEIPLQNIFKIPVGYHEHFIFHLSENKNTDSIKKLR